MKLGYIAVVIAVLAAGFVGISLFTNIGRPVKTHFDPVMP